MCIKPNNRDRIRGAALVTTDHATTKPRLPRKTAGSSPEALEILHRLYMQRGMRCIMTPQSL